jgi:hypothetical protein
MSKGYGAKHLDDRDIRHVLLKMANRFGKLIANVWADTRRLNEITKLLRVILSTAAVMECSGGCDKAAMLVRR